MEAVATVRQLNRGEPMEYSEVVEKRSRTGTSAARWTRPLCVLVVVLVVVFATSLASAQGSHSVGEVVETGADAGFRYAPDAPWQPLRKGAGLRVGMSIHTASSGTVLQFRDGATVRLEPGSMVQVQAPTQVTVNAGPPELAHRLDLRTGGLTSDVPRQHDRVLFVVHTNEILGIFRQGRSRVRIVPEGMLAVVEEGDARVASHGRWIPLSAGHYMTAGVRGATTKRLAAMPQFARQPCRYPRTGPCTIALVSAGQRASVGVRWEASPGAGSYLVLLARDRAMRDVMDDRTVAGATRRHATQPLAPGRYWVTVQSIGADGIPGMITAPRELRVVSMQLEQGSFFVEKSAVVVLPPDAVVRIDRGDGLELGTPRGVFGALPQTLRLAGDEPRRMVRVRVAGDRTDDAVIDLERRQLAAEVHLTPVSARWPKDPVDVHVRLHDPSGRVPLDKVQPQIAATLNGSPIELSLTRSDEGWRGAVSPRPGAGPWILRVEVADEAGHSLGRNFLEIVGLQDAPKDRLW
jgi:hypothetical protein